MSAFNVFRKIVEKQGQIEEIIDNLDKIEKVTKDAPELIDEVDEITDRVVNVENEVRNLTDEVRKTTEEIQLRVESRLEIAATIGFLSLGIERIVNDLYISGGAFVFLSLIFAVGLIDTILKKKKDLGYIFIKNL